MCESFIHEPLHAGLTTPPYPAPIPVERPFVKQVGIYATEVDEELKNFDLLGVRFGSAHNAPLMTLLDVTRLSISGLLFEIGATACA